MEQARMVDSSLKTGDLLYIAIVRHMVKIIPGNIIFKYKDIFHEIPSSSITANTLGIITTKSSIFTAIHRQS